MTYKLILRREAQKQLDLLSEQDYQRVARVISNLEKNPRPLKTKKLSGSGLWRVRIGRHRVVFAIDDNARTVIIVRVARRKEDTYKGL
ncbi:MAG: type II toxin-antitoxin system RelE/ParE family toxin [Dehalococcoidales bacterium]|nr:type II toxin-antitoxin system RelE/ParE family toxin [Dehalococcoidales bacterium]